ncbi:uncharacterized protein LOC122033735 [Zingiber officinale]|uniref:uncharacterized protein LOC122033735 n=1 Tax=Zingiber officinale TaxID=94328 RepID=UPI001C4BFC76|nr:uncharacterized protein LOC122033735 [Zingiber officinale]
MMFSGGSRDEESLDEWMAMLIGIPVQMSLVPREDGGGGASLPWRMKEERFLQWGQQETRDLITIKAVLERDPLAARTLGGSGGQDERRQLPLDAGPMQEQGKETADPGAAGRQWPFFDELSVVFMEHRKDMKRRLLESESGSSRRKKPKRLSSIQSSEESGSEDEQQRHIPKSKKKAADSRGVASIQELLQEFLQQQQKMELQWCEMMNLVQEWRVLELEQQQSMEKLERKADVGTGMEE